METEEQIVYSIIETAKKGNLSDDNRINERLIRAYLKPYRASAIARATAMGLVITDECFQYLGELRFDLSKSKEFTRVLPKMILLKSNFGIRFEVAGENIPVLNSEEYSLSLKSLLNGKLPKAKLTSTKATIYTGEYLVINGRQKPKSNFTIDEFQNQIRDNKNEFISIDVYGVLDNPDDGLDYDWTTTPYPCPSELIEEIKTKILSKEYNLILNLKVDKVTDSNDDDQSPRRIEQQQQESQGQ